MSYSTLSLEPLLSLARRQTVTADGDLGIFSDKEFALMIGVHSRTIARWRAADNSVPWPAADEAATALGEHAIRVWGDEWSQLDYDVVGPIPDDPVAKRQRMKLEKALTRAMNKIGEVLAEEALERDGILTS